MFTHKMTGYRIIQNGGKHHLYERWEQTRATWWHFWIETSYYTKNRGIFNSWAEAKTRITDLVEAENVVVDTFDYNLKGSLAYDSR